MQEVSLDDIHFPFDLRLRSETYGDIQSLCTSMSTYGQFMPLLVREVDPEVHPDDAQIDALFVLIDGGRRYLAAELAQRLRSDGQEVTFKGHHPSKLFVRVVPADSPLYALRLEFHANEDREDFSWKEKAEYVRRVHEQLSKEFKEDGWTQEHTAEFLKMTGATVSRYLSLTEDEEIMKDEKVAEAKTLRTAMKQAEIAKEKKRRERRAKKQKKILEESGETEQSVEEKIEALAMRMVIHGDCRSWIEEIEDESISWIHWDPPYGGEQAGGAFSTRADIDDSEEYAEDLFLDMLPELHRVLEPGRWMALWFHPARYQWTREILEEIGFWVNPYPCIWYKENRHSDGHEIRRFLVNAYETFLLCGKGERPILQMSSRQNVFVHDMVPRGARQHIMHKPADLLTEILKLISIPGEVGIDPSVGSGSIMKAAIASGRKPEGCEISNEYWLGAIETTKNALMELSST